MRDRNNPLKNFPEHAFTIIQASHADFHKELADIPSRYPTGRITYINNHQYVPLLKVREEDLNRFVHLQVSSLSDLLRIIETDTSSLLILEHNLSWFQVDNLDELMDFNAVCRKRAQKGSPVVYITVVMDRSLLKLDGKADYFIQMGKIPLRGRALALKSQLHLDNLPAAPVGVMEKAPVYGQTSIRDW